MAWYIAALPATEPTSDNRSRRLTPVSPWFCMANRAPPIASRCAREDAPPGQQIGDGFGVRKRLNDDCVHECATGRLSSRPLPLVVPANAGTTLMGHRKHTFAFSRRIAPELCQKLPALSKQRAQGMPDARCTRGLACDLHKTNCTRAYRAAENIRHSLRNGFTAYIVLSPETSSW